MPSDYNPFEGAREYIEAHGHVQGEYTDSSSSLSGNKAELGTPSACIIGAIYMAHPETDQGIFEPIDTAISFLEELLHEQYQYQSSRLMPGCLVDWNDEDGRTQAEVEKLLMQAVEAWDLRE